MKKYTVQPGKHDFRPIDAIGFLLWPLIKYRALVVGFKFGEDCLFDHKGDKDLKHDWNFKVNGVSFNPPWKDKRIDAVMMAARPNFETGWIEVTSYKNEDKGHVAGFEDEESEVLSRFRPEEEGVFIIWPESRKVWNVKIFRRIDAKTLQEVNAKVQYKWKKRASWLLTPVGTWFGGNKTAPQKCTIWLNKAWVNQSTLRKRKLI